MRRSAGDDPDPLASLMADLDADDPPTVVHRDVLDDPGRDDGPPVVIHHDEPRRKKARKAAPPPDPKDPEEVHEAGRRLGERSGEVRRQRRRAPVIPAPTYPTVSDTPTRPRTPWWFDPPRLPGRKRR